MEDKKLVEEIIRYFGGKDNIKSATHCVTRLRIYVYDETLVDKEKMEDELGLSVVKSIGQFQVIIGPGKVDDIYDIFVSKVGLDIEKSNKKANENDDKESLFSRAVALIASIFQPTLPLLAGFGMIKALVAILSAFNIIEAGTSTYIILEGIGDAYFKFMPIFVGYYSMKAFGGTPMLGAAIAAVLVSPDITQYGEAETIYTLFSNTPIESSVKAQLFGLPIILTRYGYYYSVMPIIFLTYLAAPLERFCNKHYHHTVRMFMTSATVVLVMSILGLLLLGPFISILGGLIASLFFAMKDVVPTLYGAVLGGLWQVIVMFGFHWVIVPFQFVELGLYMEGSLDKLTYLSGQMPVCFATAGAVLAVILKDKSMREIGIPAFITSMLGITEPALYGVSLPKKTPFIAASLASVVAGAWIGFTNVGTYLIGGVGIFSFANALNPNVSSFGEQTDLFNMFIACVIGFVLSLLFTLFAYKRASDKLEKKTSSNGVVAPVEGNRVEISTIQDKVFATENIGPSIAIKPSSNTIYSPVNGKVTSIFPTMHAIGFIDDNGNEILIHIGINTVELEGEDFEISIEEGDSVKAGQNIGEVNFENIEKKGYDTTVVIVSTNNQDVKKENDETFKKLSKVMVLGENNVK